jgi:hypothetical protein
VVAAAAARIPSFVVVVVHNLVVVVGFVRNWVEVVAEMGVVDIQILRGNWIRGKVAVKVIVVVVVVVHILNFLDFVARSVTAVVTRLWEEVVHNLIRDFAVADLVVVLVTHSQSLMVVVDSLVHRVEQYPSVDHWVMDF